MRKTRGKECETLGVRVFQKVAVAADGVMVLMIPTELQGIRSDIDVPREGSD